MKLKILVAFGLVGFGCAVLGIFLGSAITSKPAGPVPTTVAANGKLDAGEVAKHNSLSDCWLIIANKVYDVSTFVRDHPGGEAQIKPYCGREATAAFASRGGDGVHSSAATNLLDNYYVGTLGGEVEVQSVPTVAQEQIIRLGRDEDDD